MTSRKRIGLAASLVLGTLAFAAVAAPASAAWYGDGRGTRTIAGTTTTATTTATTIVSRR